eukprot:TRINITY_DN4310_c0_g2_i1.p1 TRINITY_DN4310_c0_g2~~TRINITY_DN4310_c0_g2_i1.p1  ORF type:complete len:208 (+),score=32.08 TRINITY_DN4310_c0_g2_i1:140-763(+)
MLGRKHQRSRAVLCSCLLASGALTVLLLGPNFVGPSRLQGRPFNVAMRAEGMSIGHILMPDGSWKLTEEGVPIQGPEEDALAQKTWEAFKTQYENAAERGVYMDTPVGEQDIKYRYRRLRDTFGITSEEAFKIMEVDALPLVIDSDYVKVTFDAMVEGSSRDKALEIISRHPGILAAGKEVKSNMLQAEVASQFIGFSRNIGSMMGR